MIDISRLDPDKSLFIVSCTHKKIWDHIPNAPDYVPARYAYKGSKFIIFLRWLEDSEIEKLGFFWMILSGKYGLIEPWHPISHHDVNLVDPESAPVSDETLKRQVRQKRLWRRNSESHIDISINNYSDIICVSCSDQYIERLSPAFPDTKLQRIDAETDLL